MHSLRFKNIITLYLSNIVYLYFCLKGFLNIPYTLLIYRMITKNLIQTHSLYNRMKWFALESN